MESRPLPNNDLFAANGWLRPELFDPLAFKALQRGVCWAADTRWESVRTPHVFMGLLSVSDRRVREWCRMLGSDCDSLLLQFAALFTQSRGGKTPIVRLHREFISENALRVLRTAHKRVADDRRMQIRLSDLLVAMFSSEAGIVAGCFADIGYSPERLAAFAVAVEEQHPTSDSR